VFAIKICGKLFSLFNKKQIKKVFHKFYNLVHTISIIAKYKVLNLLLIKIWFMN